MPNINGKNILLAVFSLSIIISLVQLGMRTVAEQSPGAGAGLHTLAYQFMPLQAVFRNVPKAGYATDKPMEHPLAVAQFELAQYALAPTVLELNNTSLPLIIVDCTSAQAAMDRTKALGLMPISVSPTGLILAANPRAKL